MFRVITFTIYVGLFIYSLGARAEFGPDLSRDSISVMSYNVENLFDSEHDEGKDDYTFLPKSFPGKMEACAKIRIPTFRELCEKTDWRPERVNLKVGQIKRVIEHQGFLPDIVGLSEVENENVLNILARATGYDHLYIADGNDSRGIDVALMFNEQKIQYVSHKEIEVGFKDSGNMKTRNVLRVHFRLKDASLRNAKDSAPVLAVYVSHWPSQSNPGKYRMAVAEIIKADIDKNVKEHGASNYHVVVMGDLNTIESESPNGIDNVLASSKWTSRLYDTEVLARGKGIKMTPPGTYYYKKNATWNRLDRILVSKNMTSRGRIVADLKSFKNLAAPFMTYVYQERNGKSVSHVPRGYDFSAESADKAGFSDHLPVFIRLNIAN
ncbi:MAG: endonuclease/exonuclease/phosphatase family protein [Pseudomonadota bacterium]|nr:endonuclease/exonuclease/phosphatase family protein [Pseudomonadota bacterium]